MMEKVSSWEWLRIKDAKRQKELERMAEFEAYKKVEKGVDKSPFICYNVITKRKGMIINENQTRAINRL
jgi:hypothetical protein